MGKKRGFTRKFNCRNPRCKHQWWTETDVNIRNVILTDRFYRDDSNCPKCGQSARTNEKKEY